jgi:DNA-binding response OmpR family regulator
MGATGLIISSNIILNKRIDVMLTMEGFTCLPVFSKEEVLHIVMKHRFDFVIVDNTSREKLFIDMIPDLRAMNIHIPIIVITRTEQDMLYDEKNQVYLVNKGFVDEHLPEKVRSILSGHEKRVQKEK